MSRGNDTTIAGDRFTNGSVEFSKDRSNDVRDGLVPLTDYVSSHTPLAIHALQGLGVATRILK